MLYDLSSLRVLTQGDDELFKELIVLFMHNLEENFAGLQKAVDEGDASAVEFIAHSIKGSVGQLKARSLFDMAYELEVIGRASRMDVAAEKLQEMLVVYQEIKTLLAKEI